MEKFGFVVEIPEGVKVHVRVGDRVRAGDGLAESGQAIEESVDVSSGLGVGKDKIGKFLKVALGQEVKVGDILAVKGGVLREKRVVAPSGGVVHKISEDQGTLSLRVQTQERKKIVSPIGGEVIGVTKEAIEIGVAAKVVSGEGGLGKLVSGNLQAVGEWGTARLDQLGSGNAGKVVVTADTINGAWLAKAEALGVLGIVAAGVDEPGSVPEGFPVLLMGAIEGGQMQKKIWEELVKRDGSWVIVDPKEKKLAVVES